MRKGTKARFNRTLVIVEAKATTGISIVRNPAQIVSGFTRAMLMSCRDQPGARDRKWGNKAIDALADELKRAVRPELTFRLPQVVGAGVLLCLVIGKELAARMDAVLPGPVTVARRSS